MSDNRRSSAKILAFKYKLFDMYKNIVNSTVISVTLSCTLVILHILPFSAFLVFFRDSFIAENIPANILTAIKFLLPHKLLGTVSFLNIAIIFGSIVLILSAYVFLFIVNIIWRKKAGLYRVYGYMSYIVNYGLFLPIISFMLGIIILGTNQRLVTDLLFRIASGIMLIAFLGGSMLDNELLISYYFNTKNKLARCPDFKMIYIKLTGFLLIVFDCLTQETIDGSITIAINLVASGFLFTYICIKGPFYDNSVLLATIYAFFIYLWFSLVCFAATILNVSMIQNGYIVLLIIGAVFSLWVVIRYRNYGRFKLFQKSIIDLDSPIEADKLLRYLYQLIESAKKSKSDDIILAATIQLHFQSCRDDECVCKDRKLSFNPLLLQYTNMRDPAFHDDIFLKNIVLSIAKQALEKFKDSQLINLNYILVQLELLGNIPQCTSAITQFDSKFKTDMNIFYQFTIYNSRMFVGKILKKIVLNKGQQMVNYENIKTYDKLMDTAK